MKTIKPENNFIWLTMAMIGLMVFSAFSRHFPDSLTIVLLEAAGIVLMLISLMSLDQHKKWKRRLLVVIGLMFVTAIVSFLTGQVYADMFYLFLWLAFLLVAGRLVASEVLLRKPVEVNKIIGAIALYLIIGMIWSVLYTMVIELWPTAFNGIEAGPWYENLPTTTYFSFVTLTTLGYGDISPVEPMAEVLVILEAITGMFYLAIVVASLVGALIADWKQK